jgi:CheY-like chemotaxis protein
VGDRLALLEEKLLRLSHDLLHFDHLVVRVLDRQTNRLDTVLAGGLSEAAKDLEIRAEPEGQGITGHVAATGRSYICPDISKDPRYLPGLDNARSSVTVPLWLYDQVVGTLNVESDQIAAFGEEDRQYAEILGRYLAMALNLLKLLAVERSTTTDKLAADVASELATPLNDIVSETTRLLESHGGDDEVKRRAKVVLDSVERARRVLRSVSEHHGVTGLAPERPDRDGLLAGKTILVADDEDIIRETVSEVLTQHGARVLTARDGSDAAALIRAEPHVDLVLSDIKMPGKNGYEIFAAVRLAHPTCPVILITGFGYDPNHSIVRAGKEGLAGVLFKPFKVEQMLDEVRTALQPKALR